MYKHWGATLYRAGSFSKAVERLSEIDEFEGGECFSVAYGWYFLAMAHQRLGDADKAAEAVGRAEMLANEQLSEADSPAAWNRKATLRMLRKDAEAHLTTDGDLAEPTAVPNDHSH